MWDEGKTMTQDDPKDLIALYALDALEPDEARFVEAYLERHPEAWEELRAHREVAARLARSVPPVDPPPYLEARVMERIRALGENRALETNQPAKPAPIPFTPKPQPAPSPLRWIAPALALVASIAAIVLAVQNARLGAELAAQRLLGLESAQIIAAGARSLPMKTPDGQAEVGRVLVAPDGRVLFVHTLGAVPQGKTWQAWYIQANNPAPVSLGVFDGSSVLKRIPDGVAALGVSEEPAGGSATPTLIRGLANI